MSDEDLQKKIAPIREKVERLNEKALFKMLKDPDPKYALVRDLAFKATLQNDAGCNSEDKNVKTECIKRVAGLLAAHRTRWEFGVDSSTGSTESSGSGKKSSFDSQALFDLWQNHSFNSVMDPVHREAMKLITDTKLEKKIEKKIFPEVRSLLIEKLKNLVQDPVIQKKLIQKIENIQFAGVDCSDILGEGTRNHLRGLMYSNAYYSSVNQTFSFCNGFLLGNTSEFSIAMVIAHEISHSIDPCHIQMPESASPMVYRTENATPEAIEDQHPVPGLLQCLRSRESIGAVARDTRNRQPFCSSDQIGEAFSDWMGAEILEGYMEKNAKNLSPQQKVIGYSNVYRSLKGCDSSEEHFDVHPGKKARIDRLIMANPGIREQIGFGEPSNGLHYCKAGENFTGTRAVYIDKGSKFKEYKGTEDDDDGNTPKGDHP